MAGAADGLGNAFAGIALIGAGRAQWCRSARLLCASAPRLLGNREHLNRRAQAPDALALLVWSSLVPPLPLFALSLALEGRTGSGVR